MKSVRRLFALAVLVTGFCVAGTAWSGALTTADPAIPLDELKLRLNPLTRDELKEEAAAWQQLLKEKATQIGIAEIAVKHRKEELSRAEALDQALVEKQAAETALKEAPEGDGKARAAAEEDLKAAEKKLRDARESALQTMERTTPKPDIAQIEAAARKHETAKEAREAKEAAEAGEESPGESAGDGSGDGKEGRPLSEAERKLQKAVEERERTRAELLDYLTELRAQQTGLIDRLNAVIDAWEKKGAPSEDIEQYRQYVHAVSGIKVDVSDAQATWVTVMGWLKSEQGGLRWLKNISLFIIIVVVSVFLARLAARGTGKVLDRSPQASQLLGDFMVATVRRVVLVIGILVGLSAMEINVGPLLAVIGAAGFVIAFALQDSLGNFASGILILVFRPFDVGDVIEVAGVLGKVESMNLLSIRVRTPDNKAVIIPNNNVWADSIINVTGTATRRVDLVFGIAYDDDMGKAQRIMEEVVAAHEKVLDDPEPVVRVNELADSSVNFVCRPWVRTEDYWDVYWDLTRRVKERFDQEGISIPFPQRDVHLIQETSTAAEQTPAEDSDPQRPAASKRGGGRTASVDDQLRNNPEVIGDDVSDDSV